MQRGVDDLPQLPAASSAMATAICHGYVDRCAVAGTPIGWSEPMAFGIIANHKTHAP